MNNMRFRIAELIVSCILKHLKEFQVNFSAQNIDVCLIADYSYLNIRGYKI